jgi:putative acetyltransferase
MPDSDDLTIAAERPDQPAVIALVEALDAHLSGLYPPESNYFLDIEALCAPSVAFFVARLRGSAVGCGALVHDPRGWGELKRMFVAPEARGRRVGARIIAALEDAARARALDLLRLETGARSIEALALYRAAGFADRGPFGDYPPDPNSVFMEKRIAAR